MASTSTLNAVAAGIEGATQGFNQGLVLAGAKTRADKDKDDDAYAAELSSVWDEDAAAATPSGAGSPGVDPRGSPRPGNPDSGIEPKPDEGDGEKPVDTMKPETKDAAGEFTYDPSRYEQLPDSMRGYRDQIMQNEKAARVAMKHGKVRDAMMFKSYAREGARMLETDLNRGLDAETKRATIEKMLKEQISRGRIDVFDLAMAGDVSAAEQMTGQFLPKSQWAKDGTLKADKKTGIVTYQTEGGGTVSISKQFRETMAKNIGYGNKGIDRDVMGYMRDVRKELVAEKEDLKTELAGIGPDSSDEATRPQRIKVKRQIKDVSDQIRDIDKKIKAGIDEPTSEPENAGIDNLPAESPAPDPGLDDVRGETGAMAGNLMSQEDFVTDFIKEVGREPTPVEIERAKGKHWQ